MIPRHLLKYSRGVNDWRWIEEVIEKEGHPTNFALAMALAGPEPVPRLVQDYLAERFRSDWPQGGRTKTPWEKSISVGLGFKDGEIAENIFFAAVDVEYIWAYCKFCRHFLKEKDFAKAVNLTIKKYKKMPPGWPKLDAGDLTAMFGSFMDSAKWDPNIYAKKKFGDIINEVSESEEVDAVRLGEFFRTGADRFDFR